VSEVRSVEHDRAAEPPPEVEARPDVKPSAEVLEELKVPSSPAAADDEADQVSLRDAADAPPPAEDSKEDTTPFGAGIT
jgi:hypothetical protein